MVFFFCFEKNIHLFIRLIRTSLSHSRPSRGFSGNAGEHETSGNDCILYVFFLFSAICVYFVCVCVCLSTAIIDNPNSVLPRNCIFLYFFFTSYLHLNFSKTPFHVVLSKNKTNTKKKYHFSLLISVSFHSSQF